MINSLVFICCYILWVISLTPMYLISIFRYIETCINFASKRCEVDVGFLAICPVWQSNTRAEIN